MKTHNILTISCPQILYQEIMRHDIGRQGNLHDFKLCGASAYLSPNFYATIEKNLYIFSETTKERNAGPYTYD